VQWVGAAIVAPATLAIITTAFTEGPPRNRALGVWGAVAAHAATAGWGSAQTLGCLAAAAALLALFLIVESRHSEPLLPLSLLRIASVRAANLIRLLNGAYLYAMFYFVSLYLQQILGQTPIQVGLSYLPLALTIFIAARLASRLITITGTKPPLIAGLLLSALGLLWFSRVPAHGGSFPASVLGPSLLAAVGSGSRSSR
jgi:predicted MFS family arabinose efflux permease